MTKQHTDKEIDAAIGLIADLPLKRFGFKKKLSEIILAALEQMKQPQVTNEEALADLEYLNKEFCIENHVKYSVVLSRLRQALTEPQKVDVDSLKKTIKDIDNETRTQMQSEYVEEPDFEGAVKAFSEYEVEFNDKDETLVKIDSKYLEAALAALKIAAAVQERQKDIVELLPKNKACTTAKPADVLKVKGFHDFILWHELKILKEIRDG